jgi:hypothetical protein
MQSSTTFIETCVLVRHRERDEAPERSEKRGKKGRKI